MLIYLACGGCHYTQAKLQAVESKPLSAELALTKEQIAFIENNVPKVLAWEIYWTWADAEEDQFYVEHVGKKVPFKYIGLKGAVIVFNPQELHLSVMYVRMPDGRLSYPGIASLGEGQETIEGLLKFARSSLGWSQFIQLLQSSAGEELNRKLTPEQRQMYLNLFPRSKIEAWVNEQMALRQPPRPPVRPANPPTKEDEPLPKLEYWVGDAEITLPPPGPPPYEPVSEDKQLLLERILQETIKYTEMMFKKGELATITVPNFNVGDPRIWVLMEHEQGGGAIIDIQLNTNPKDEPVSFAGVVTYDIRVDRYGIKDDSEEKIRRQALKILKHRIKK